jgi:hypothetical protein
MRLIARPLVCLPSLSPPASTFHPTCRSIARDSVPSLVHFVYLCLCRSSRPSSSLIAPQDPNHCIPTSILGKKNAGLKLRRSKRDLLGVVARRKGDCGRPAGLPKSPARPVGPSRPGVVRRRLGPSFRVGLSDPTSHRHSISSPKPFTPTLLDAGSVKIIIFSMTSQKQPIHILVVGAGAVGCFYASKLHHVSRYHPAETAPAIQAHPPSHEPVCYRPLTSLMLGY